MKITFVSLSSFIAKSIGKAVSACTNCATRESLLKSVAQLSSRHSGEWARQSSVVSRRSFFDFYLQTVLVVSLISSDVFWDRLSEFFLPVDIFFESLNSWRSEKKIPLLCFVNFMKNKKILESMVEKLLSRGCAEYKKAKNIQTISKVFEVLQVADGWTLKITHCCSLSCKFLIDTISHKSKRK